MKQGWISKKVYENACGLYSTRWYIKSPSGNFYKIYRGHYFDVIYMTKDIKDNNKSICIGKTWSEAIQKIYEIEEKGTYSKQLSNEIENCNECRMIYSSNHPSCSYAW